MNARNLERVLTHTFRAKIPDITEGPSGLGKTEVKHQVASKLGMRLCLLYPSTADPVDFSGLPLSCEIDGVKRVIRHFDDLLATIFEANDPTIVHFDELGQGDHSVQKAIAPFFSPERRINHYTLPECVSITASTNSAQHRTGSNPILVHIRSRVYTLHLEPDLDSFMTRATLDGIDPLIMSFLRHNPAMLYEIELLPANLRTERGLSWDKVYSSGEGYTCPRSWYRTQELMRAQVPDDLVEEVFTGTIGQVAAALFVTHCRYANQKLDLDGVVNKGLAFKFPPAKEPGLRWAFCYGVAALANKGTLARVFDIANMVHAQGVGDYGIIIAQQVMAANPRWSVSDEFKAFCKSPLGKVVGETRI